MIWKKRNAKSAERFLYQHLTTFIPMEIIFIALGLVTTIGKTERAKQAERLEK